jgi:hypothetical protein
VRLKVGNDERTMGCTALNPFRCKGIGRLDDVKQSHRPTDGVRRQ